MRQWPFMVEHLAKVAAIHPSAARRTSIKMLLFRQIAHAMANVLPARKLNDRAPAVQPCSSPKTRGPLLVPLGASLLLLLLYRSPLLLRRGNIGQPQPSLSHVGQSSLRVPVSKRTRHF